MSADPAVERLEAAERDAWRLIFAAYTGQKIELTSDEDAVMAAATARLRGAYERR
jgi:hypothetical protein